MNNVQLLSEIQHKMWQKFVSNLTKNVRKDGSVLIKPATVSRWKELLSVDYKDLPDKTQQNIQKSVEGYVELMDQTKSQPVDKPKDQSMVTPKNQIKAQPKTVTKMQIKMQPNDKSGQ